MPRSMSIMKTSLAEEAPLDYDEIESIPPLLEFLPLQINTVASRFNSFLY